MKTAAGNQPDQSEPVIGNTCLMTVLLSSVLVLSACGDEGMDPPAATGGQPAPVAERNDPVNGQPGTSATPSNAYTIGNKRYFFDVTDHTVEELQALLERIEEITEASPETFDELEVVMVLHGPDIGLFTQANYKQNRKLVDLAAKLDAFNIVDMKACETAMNSLGYKQSDIPPFIETVPYAPAEIERLQEQGYINL